MARDLNKAQLLGRLGVDPELRYTQAGRQVAQFSLATNNRYTNAAGDKIDDVSWHRIVVWGKVADLAAQYLHKGSRVYVEGRLQYRQWDDKDGITRYTTEIVAEDLIFLDAAGAGQEHSNGDHSKAVGAA